MQTLENFNQADFIKNVWQKKHLLIKQAISQYQSPLDGDDLAGLSLEETAESRIIIQHDKDTWELQYGPFAEDHYTTLPEKNWTLLVQAVDHWLDEINDLKQYFRFIPDWRIDDVMISYAATGGGVGPHFDQYDVFLLQAQGTRRWKIGQQCDEQSPLLDNPDIKQLAEFNTQAEYVCQAGDILYVPPGLAHWGISESDDCMTISIGFRAPSHEQLLSRLCDDLAANCTEDQRYSDQDLSKLEHPSQISPAAIEQITQMLQEKLSDSDAIIRSFGRLMTEPKYPDNFVDCGCESEEIYRRNDARLAYFNDGEQLYLFANGECIYCPLEDEAFIQQLCDEPMLDLIDLNSQQHALVEQLISLGIYEDA